MKTIHCNGCQYLCLRKRKIGLNNRTNANVWILFCEHPKFKGSVHIDTTRVINQDINQFELPEIEVIWECPKRQKERIKGNESKFEKSIN